MITGLDVDITPLIPCTVERGGHVRVGLADGFFGARKTNVEFVEEAARQMNAADGELASAAEIRRAFA